MSEDLPLERHSRFRRLHDYLQSKAPPGRLPGRQHIEPGEIRDLLPHIALMEVVPQPAGPPRFRIRLAGTAVVIGHGSEITGRFLDEIVEGPAGVAITEKCQEAVRTGRPNYRRSVVAVRNREHVAYERIVFPLARDGEHVDMLAVVFAKRGSVEKPDPES